MKNPSKKQNKYILPRGYLSWTQLNLWEKNPQEYARVYIYGKESYVNEAMILGKNFASEMEKDSSDDDLIELYRTRLGNYPKKEFVIETEVDTIPIKCVLDGFDRKSGMRIGEYKTGIIAWTQSKVDSSGQLLFYNTGVYKKYKKIAKESKLYWLKTMLDEDGDLTLTGDIHEYTMRKVELMDIVKMSVRIKKAAEGITKLMLKESIFHN